MAIKSSAAGGELGWPIRGLSAERSPHWPT